MHSVAKSLKEKYDAVKFYHIDVKVACFVFSIAFDKINACHEMQMYTNIYMYENI